RAACQPPAGGPSGLTQYFAEARPAPRILQVLRDVGLNSFVGSLCPKFSLPSDASADGYGFNPVGRHLMDSTLTDGSPGNLACTGRSLSSDESGQVSCVAVEVWPEELLPQLSEEEACAEPGRAPADDASRARTVKQLRESG